MAVKSCLPLLHSTLFHFHQHTASTNKTLFSISFPKSTLPTQKFNSQSGIHESQNDIHLSSLCLSKRKLNLTVVTTFLWGILPNIRDAFSAEELQLQRYTDLEEGFTILIPSSWKKVDKAGATVLFQEADMGSNSIGVVVNPVRLASLGEFGSPQFVADKLLQAERRKESTKEAEVIEVTERSGKGGLQIYEFEYKVDSSRGGIKRIFSAAFVTSKKLYLLNIAHSDKPESPLDPPKRMILEQVLHSFDAVTTA